MNKLDNFESFAWILSKRQDSGAAGLQDFEDTTNEDQTAPNTPNLHSFEEALKALKNGKYIQRKNSYPFGLQSTPNPIVGLEQMRSNSSFRWNDVLGNDWIIHYNILEKENKK